MKTIVRALAHRNYRLYFGGQFVSLIGTAMQQIAMSWLVYRLTGSTVMLGLIAFIGQIPSLILAPIGGILSDRYDRRTLLVGTQFLSAIHAAVLAALTYGGEVSPAFLIFLAFLLGLIKAIDQPVRQSFIAELVEKREDLPNAVALTSFTIHSARFIGPSIGGILVAGVGEAACFAVDALSYFAVLVALLAMTTQPVPAVKHRTVHALREGFCYAVAHREIRILLCVVATVSFFGSPYSTLLPYFAREIYAGGARSYGFLATASGVGACLGTIFLASRKSPDSIDRSILRAMPIISIGLVAFATTKLFFIAALSLAIMGFASINTVAASSAVIQHLVEDGMRGRVMAIYTMAFFGISPVGALVTGYAARHFGAQQTLIVSAAAILVVWTAAAWARKGAAPATAAAG